MTIMEEVIEEMQNRNFYKAEEIVPPFVVSFMLHCFNLHNKDAGIYYFMGDIPKITLPILYVSPPGFGKSLIFKNLLRGRGAIFKNSGIPFRFETHITEAALVGSFDVIGDTVIEVEGIAKKMSRGILAVDEFSAVLLKMKDNILESQVLQLIDHGYVNKTLKHGQIAYESQLTLWAGVQPMAIDLRKGLGRRFWYVLSLPSPKEFSKIRRARSKARDYRDWNYIDVSKYRAQLKNIQKLKFDESLVEYYEKLKLFPFEDEIFERFIMGWCLSTDELKPVMEITLEGKKDLKEYLQKAVQWRRIVLKGADSMQLLILLRYYRRLSQTDILDYALGYGLDDQKTIDILNDLKRRGLIIKNGKYWEIK